MKQALIVWGGWNGHEPEKVARICESLITDHGLSVEVSDTLDSLNDAEAVKQRELIVPIWTMGKISKDQANAVCEAVADGTGLVGCHGGMCDAFRESVQWQFMTGGNWVAHPGGDGVEYRVHVVDTPDSLCHGLSDFTVHSEQYYLHVDPAVTVHATTRFPTVKWYHTPNGDVDMPVVWTKMWGAGRVFYTSLGHHADVFDIPQAMEILRRGIAWAGESKQYAREHELSAAMYSSDKKMF